ncbi:LysR family transcriptional regulator [Acidisoma cellulosilytica]|uniref:LysR family transcriptional regulator n=1 Tax=Acidisoma cellulosilyticum TaxID=2802395 RepID=A0A963Z521_9PROT|nr:LysR family transcriptional regulator [Acidisoma cellulosilyticum]MCB8882155.1 LysR family transcriptional regulator [Acidisoma cellulosilyticum]
MSNRRTGRLANDLDWNLLRAFWAIAEEGSISRAAVALCRSQPAVSIALKRLEQQLGIRLAVRSATSFRLTDAGRILHRECSEIFHTITHMPKLLEEESESLVGTLQIRLASHIVSDLVDSTFSEFHRRYPRVTMDISVSPSSSVVESTMNKSTKIGICLASVKHPDLEYLHLYREHFAFFCGRSHHLFGKEGLTLRDLEGEPAVSFRVFTFSDWVQTIGALNKQANLAVPMVGISDNLEELRRLLVAGVGIGAMPIHVMKRDLDDGLLWRLPPYDDPPAIDVYLVTNPRSQLGRIEAAFVRLLSAIVDTQPLSERTYPRAVGRPTRRSAA